MAFREVHARALRASRNRKEDSGRRPMLRAEVYARALRASQDRKEDSV